VSMALHGAISFPDVLFKRHLSFRQTTLFVDSGGHSGMGLPLPV
jgi:hypothetical protein